MRDIALVRVTFANAAEAERIGAAMVADGLAACVNIGQPCHSIFRWHGAVQREDEVAAVFKTTVALASTLSARIAELHSYDQPVIERWPASVDDAVADWIERETGA